SKRPISNEIARFRELLFAEGHEPIGRIGRVPYLPWPVGWQKRWARGNGPTKSGKRICHVLRAKYCLNILLRIPAPQHAGLRQNSSLVRFKLDPQTVHILEWVVLRRLWIEDMNNCIPLNELGIASALGVIFRKCCD